MAQKKEKTTICESAITCIAFSPDFTRVAFSPNNHQIHVYLCQGADCTKWGPQATLEEHGQSVTGIAWGAKTNRILSCAQDRTAFVWSEGPNGSWVPCHVLLDAAVKRGLTSCAWNATEDRVFICSAAFNVAVGKYDDPNPFWSCVVVTPHKSTVACVAAHPTEGRCLATGSTDNTAKITTIKGRTPTYAATFRACGWINAIAWSPSGTALAFASHGGEVHVAVGTDPADFTTFVAGVVRLSSLPLRSLAFVSDTALIGAGHDFYPIGFKPKGGSAAAHEWVVDGKFMGAPKALKKELLATELARQKWQNESSLGQQETVEMPDTKHTNTISAVVAVPSGAATPFKGYQFATGSMDGRIELWAMEEMQP